MTSKKRLIRTIRCQPADRIPITTYELNPWSDGWRNREPSYAPVLEAQKRYGATFAFAPVADPNFDAFLIATGELQDPYERRGPGETGLIINTHPSIERGVRRETTADGELFTFTYTAGGKRLRTSYIVKPGTATSWQVEPLLKSAGDIDILLSFPEEVPEPELTYFRSMESRLGDNGLMLLSLGDPLGLLFGLFRYEDFLIFTRLERRRLDKLLAGITERLTAYLDNLSRQVDQTVFRFWGPEAVAPPMADPETFDRLVTRPDGPIIDLVKSSGNLAFLHCHGPVKAVIDRFVDLGPHLIEPIEPPPSGDMTLEELFEACDGRVALMGHVQYSDLEMMEPEGIERLVADLMEKARDRNGFIVGPSAGPVDRVLPSATADNLVRFLKAGYRYGRR